MVTAQQFDDNQHMTKAEYFAFSEAEEIRYEYCKGEVIAMVGSNIRHSMITVNIGTYLYTLLRDDEDALVLMTNMRIATHAH